MERMVEIREGEMGQDWDVTLRYVALRLAFSAALEAS